MTQIESAKHDVPAGRSISRDSLQGATVVDWYKRLRVWKRATEERLKKRWWLWPVLFAADLVWHEICESTDHFLESRGAPIIARMLSIIPSNPAVLAVMTAVLILVTLAVHAYFDTRNVSSVVAQAHAAGLRPQNTVSVIPCLSGGQEIAGTTELLEFRDVDLR